MFPGEHLVFHTIDCLLPTNIQIHLGTHGRQVQLISPAFIDFGSGAHWSGTRRHTMNETSIICVIVVFVTLSNITGTTQALYHRPPTTAALHDSPLIKFKNEDEEIPIPSPYTVPPYLSRIGPPYFFVPSKEADSQKLGTHIRILGLDPWDPKRPQSPRSSTNRVIDRGSKSNSGALSHEIQNCESQPEIPDLNAPITSSLGSDKSQLFESIAENDLNVSEWSSSARKRKQDQEESRNSKRKKVDALFYPRRTTLEELLVISNLKYPLRVKRIVNQSERYLERFLQASKYHDHGSATSRGMLETIQDIHSEIFPNEFNQPLSSLDREFSALWERISSFNFLLVLPFNSDNWEKLALEEEKMIFDWILRQLIQFRRQLKSDFRLLNLAKQNKADFEDLPTIQSVFLIYLCMIEKTGGFQSQGQESTYSHFKRPLKMKKKDLSAARVIQTSLSILGTYFKANNLEKWNTMFQNDDHFMRLMGYTLYLASINISGDQNIFLYQGLYPIQAFPWNTATHLKFLLYKPYTWGILKQTS